MRLLAALLLFLPQKQLHQDKLNWVPNPRTANGSWVSDPAHHLAAATVTELNRIISGVESANGTEIAVVVIDSLDGLEPSEAALTLHRRWGVGKRDRDNGLVILWCPKCRQTFVSVGDGLEGVLPDAKVGRIQDEYMIPSFRAGDFDAGMLNTVSALADVARGEQFVGPKRIKLESEARIGGGTLATIIVAPILLLIGGIFGAVRYARNKPRMCPNGHGKMRRLSESEDDARLDAGQRTEEEVHSVDYDVWVCDTCNAATVVQYNRWFTLYRACPQCKRRTLKTTEKVITSPTYTSTGKGQRTKSCKNCGFNKVEEYTIARKTVSSSGGGSSGGGGGGGSFGGGSSSGGGAGRSY